MTRWPCLVVVVCLFGSTSARAIGPVVEVGGMLAGHEPDPSSSTDYNRFSGLTTSVGIELGDRFNHELALEWARLADLSPHIALAETVAAHYMFSVDFLGKHGFTPSIGVGLAIGRFAAIGSGEAVSGLYLAGRLRAGLRYTFGWGLGVRADLTASVYGNGNFGLMPVVGVSWRF